MGGSLVKLYKSIENLTDTYMQPNLNEGSLLKPKTTISGANILQANNDSNAPKRFYLCVNCKRHISDSPVTTCPTCISLKISTQVFYVAPPLEPTGVTCGNIKGGYVKSDIMYMIMDDLEVKPMSTVSCITLLKTLNFKKVDAFEEKVVDLDIEEGLKLVKASLESKTALTNVFLGKKVHEGMKVQVVALSSYEHQEEKFMEEVGQLRQHFPNYISHGGLASDRIPASAF